MSVKKVWKSGWTVGGLLVALLVYTGCEVTSDKGEVTITPSSATVREGKSVTLTAAGGRTYMWRLENEAWGRLNARRGQTVVYTSRHTPASGASAVQKITVTADVAGTNEAPTTLTGEAFITHLSDGIVVRLTPTTATLRGVGATAAFTAAGGTRYEWRLSQTDWGTLSALTGARTTYQNLKEPPADGSMIIQTLTVKDVPSGVEASAQIYLYR